jgi:hypothetical protein
MYEGRFSRGLFRPPYPSIGLEKDGSRRNSTSGTEEHVNGLEYIKGVLKVMIRILVTIDMSHVKEQISDLINGNGNRV